MTVKVLRTDPAAQLPVYAHPGDAGMDVRSIEDVTLSPGARALIHTGLVLMLPPNAEAQVRPRSGLAFKHGVTVLNTPGTIDAGYRGEVGVILINLGTEPFVVEKGMKIAQLVVSPVAQAEVVEVTSVDETDRGAGGFGSTGV
ncbi:MAG: dUTP diphosphatase [Kiritimatiellae bacterium]|nr:dUTP diphosphatase [Kiritimatiellia bacterium]